jgi:anti-sigma regulatory factor (Ser/Thr protein kinase)
MLITMPNDVSAPAAARNALRQLAPPGAPDRVQQAQLLVSELVTNSVRHAVTSPADQVVLELDIDDRRIRAEVRDTGRGMPRPQPEAVRSAGLGGFGLYLVAQVATRWGVEPLEVGKRVWFELDLTG